ncbi:hypothetical protein NPIL_87181 [Nephila pilipes]|uniref:Uncharacterized protein n=1 Tax=Nephila pilipes TaxID=299642 RepID=A0A8X6QFD3_NEPPI|nr:hypothetical protein NPIL_87181 [Nephila pilipes]
MNYDFRLQYHLRATSPVSRPLSPETYRKTHTLSAKGALQPFPCLLMDFQLPFEAEGDARNWERKDSLRLLSHFPRRH